MSAPETGQRDDYEAISSGAWLNCGGFAAAILSQPRPARALSDVSAGASAKIAKRFKRLAKPGTFQAAFSMA